MRSRKVGQTVRAGLCSMNSETEKYFYKEFWMEELDALVKLWSFKIFGADVFKDYFLYKSRFVDLIKIERTKRLIFCVSDCNDDEHGLITTAFTIKRISIRALLSVNVTEHLKIYTTDVTKAFMMTKTLLWRSIYMHVLKGMGL